ncbi:hypothetical protein [Streptomyces sp. SCL15-4]|uniref:DUF6197 family protein n=1 Tax=Streptomyces sp. SCL15-4 TaxID=2967221 RepID=UPI002965DAA4|nr:hypothetical protein [Streptomyces sp. SCL15-4]
MIDTPTLASPFAADAVTEAALAEARRRDRFWVGYSGETIPGAEVADYLDALRGLLEQHGWTRTYQQDDPEIPEIDESMSLKAMIVSAWRYVREALGPDRGPLTLITAQLRVDSGGAAAVGDRVLNALVAGLTGTSSAIATAWVVRRGRTWGEVRDLLAAGADFARAHGPAALSETYGQES